MYREEMPTLGCDPEFFIVKTIGENAPEVLSADKFLPSKMNKFKGNAGSIFFDGVQAEINPFQSQCRETLTWNIFECLVDTFKFVDKKRNADSRFAGKYNFWAIPSIDITKDTIKDADRECKRFGCSPDVNIYTDVKVKYPNGTRHMVRYAGGHIHLGNSNLKTMEYFSKADNVRRLIRNLDVFVGITSVAMIRDNEGEKIRRRYYGKAGTFRINNHGVEYRVPSSFWLSSPQMVSLIFALARNAYTATFRGLDNEEPLNNVDEGIVRKIIDNCDRNKAISFFNDVLVPYYESVCDDLYDEGDDDILDDAIFYSPLIDEETMDKFLKFMENGYETYFKSKKVLQNWGITTSEDDYGSESFDNLYGFQQWSEEKL